MSAAIDLDTNATSPVRPEAWEAMRPWLTGRSGNPASAHTAGRRARQALEDARDRVANLLGAFPDEVVFTSGATEANNLAIFGLCGDPPGHIVASPVEHPCVTEPLKQLAARGFTVDWQSVDEKGIVSLGEVPADTRLVAVMLANHETGAVMPIGKAACGLASAPFHTDAAQAVGKIPVHFHDLGVTTLSASGHKFGGPPGVGVLLVNRCATLRPILYGGHQQRGRRPGTEPVALAVGFAAALDAVLRDREATFARMVGLRRRFAEELRRHAAPVILNGPDEGGLPHVLNLSFPGCRSDALLMALDLAGVMCSTGSACSSGSLLPSPVLKAMGVSDERLHSAMRFSFDPVLAEADVDEAVRRIAACVTRVRANTDSA
jgi:cysteine desulfurase